MTRRIDLLPDPRERAALEALWRAGGYSQAQIEAVDDHLDADEPFDAGIREVRAILAALDTLPPQPRQAGPLNAADAQALRLDLGVEAVAIVAWMPGDGAVDLALAAAGNRGLTRRCAPDQAAALATAIATALPLPIPDPTPEPQS